MTETGIISLSPSRKYLPVEILGTLSPAMANAVASSNAYRVLIPMNLCSTYVAGVDKKSSAILDDAMAHIRSLLEGMENKP